MEVPVSLGIQPCHLANVIRDRCLFSLGRKHAGYKYYYARRMTCALGGSSSRVNLSVQEEAG